MHVSLSLCSVCLALGGALGTTFVPKAEVGMVEVGPLGDPAAWPGWVLIFISSSVAQPLDLARMHRHLRRGGAGAEAHKEGAC